MRTRHFEGPIELIATEAPRRDGPDQRAPAAFDFELGGVQRWSPQ